jgi:hypothetical protein
VPQAGDVAGRLVEDAYKARSQITLEVVDAVKTDESVAYATEMSGVLRDRFELSPEGAASGQCEGSGASIEDMRLVRIHPPVGERTSPTGG